MGVLMSVGPDCREGKHRVCDGRGFDLLHDEIIQCSCDCHNDGTNLDGATTEPQPYAEAATAGEFAAIWNAHTEAEREQAWKTISGALRRADTCFMHDHVGHVRQLELRLASVDVHEIELLRAEKAKLAAVIEQARPGLEACMKWVLDDADTDAALREVRAKALEDAARAIVGWDHLFGPDAHEWLVARASDIREGGDGDG